MIEAHLNTVKFEKATRMVPARLKVELGDAFDHISLKFLKTFKQKTRIKMHPHGIFMRFKRQFYLPTGGQLDKMGVEIYTESKIARMHEEGAVINAKGGGRLAVPFSPEYRPEMYTAGGRLRMKFKRPGMLKRTGIVISKLGKALLVQFEKGVREIKGRPSYALKEKITIPRRLDFYKIWTDMRQINFKILNQAPIRALKKV